MADSDAPAKKDATMPGDEPAQVKAAVRTQPTVVRAKPTARTKAHIDIIDKLKGLQYHVAFEAEAEIASAKEHLEPFEDLLKESRDTGAAQTVVDHAEAMAKMARKELDMKYIEMCTKQNLLRQMVKLLEAMLPEP